MTLNMVPFHPFLAELEVGQHLYWQIGNLKVHGQVFFDLLVCDCHSGSGFFAGDPQYSASAFRTAKLHGIRPGVHS